MTHSLESLQRQARSISGIRSVVHTMKTLSAINATPYEKAAQSIESYRETVLSGLQVLLHSGANIDLSIPPDARRAIVIFGSDHGLCGNYNERIASLAATSISELDVNPCNIVCIGAQMNDALEGQGLSSRIVLFTPANADGLARLAGEVVSQLDSMTAEARNRAIIVELIYTRQVNHGNHETRVRRLLPLAPELINRLKNEPWKSTSLPWMRESADTLFATFVRNYLYSGIYYASALAMASENAARLTQMQQAERAVDEQLQLLGDRIRSARQSQITAELLDVVAGFEAITQR